LQARGILRLAYKLVEPAGEARYQASPLAASDVYVVEEYRVVLDSLIIQPMEYPDVGRYRGLLRLAPWPWWRYCKWHNGPLDRRDEPWRRIYCTVRVDDTHEYCRQHRRSERFLYDICMGLRGEKALEACRRLDQAVKAEYAVYLLVQQGGHVKVGSTRAWRVLERVAEQPHAAATMLAVFDSAYQARRAEMRVSSSGIASEHRPRAQRRMPPPGAAAAALTRAAEEASKLLGVEWDGRIFRVPPLGGAPPRALDPGRLGEEPYKPTGYWGGLLRLEDPSRGLAFWVDERKLLHHNAILYDEDELKLGA
jgi:hypothetical protein